MHKRMAICATGDERSAIVKPIFPACPIVGAAEFGPPVDLAQAVIYTWVVTLRCLLLCRHSRHLLLLLVPHPFASYRVGRGRKCNTNIVAQAVSKEIHLRSAQKEETKNTSVTTASWIQTAVV
jgi:hypothetical protein